mgnify:CR=1 FL=1
MASKSHDLTHGPLVQQIILFSLPLMATNVLQVLFNMSDVAVVGQFAGPEALGSVGSTSILVSLFTGFLIGMGSGVNVVVARYIGARHDQDVHEAVHTSLILSLIVGVIIMALGFLFTPAMLSMLGTKPVLMAGAVSYLRIYCLGMPAMAVFNFGNAVLSAAGDTKKPLYFLSMAGVINILLNLFFVIVCHLAAAGVALASIISQYISAALVILSLRRSGSVVRLERSMLRIEPHKARQVLSLSIPAGLQNAIFAIANLFIQAGVNSFDELMVEGNAAAANADALVYDVMAAIYTACSSFMSQNYGAGKKKRVRNSYLISLAYSFGIGLILGVSLVFFGRAFLSLFTSDAAVMNAGMYRLTIMGFSYCISAFMDCTIAAARAMGKSIIPMFIVIMGSCVFRVIWVYTVFAYFHTIPSLYLLYVFSWSITAVAEILYFIRIYKQKMALLS